MSRPTFRKNIALVLTVLGGLMLIGSPFMIYSYYRSGRQWDMFMWGALFIFAAVITANNYKHFRNWKHPGDNNTADIT